MQGHGHDFRWGLRKFFFWVFRLENTSSLFTLYPSHQSNYQPFDYLLMITVQFNSTFKTQLQRFALNIIFLHCLGLTDVLSANQHAEISACILSTQLAFSVQVKVLWYDFSTVFHSKETISENRSIGISVERTKSRRNLLALQKNSSAKKAKSDRGTKSVTN